MSHTKAVLDKISQFCTHFFFLKLQYSNFVVNDAHFALSLRFLPFVIKVFTKALQAVFVFCDFKFFIKKLLFHYLYHLYCTAADLVYVRYYGSYCK